MGRDPEARLITSYFWAFGVVFLTLYWMPLLSPFLVSFFISYLNLLSPICVLWQEFFFNALKECLCHTHIFFRGKSPQLLHFLYSLERSILSWPWFFFIYKMKWLKQLISKILSDSKAHEFMSFKKLDCYILFDLFHPRFSKKLFSYFFLYNI